jgi:hypothetical protein
LSFHSVSWSAEILKTATTRLRVQFPVTVVWIDARQQVVYSELAKPWLPNVASSNPTNLILEFSNDTSAHGYGCRGRMVPSRSKAKGLKRLQGPRRRRSPLTTSCRSPWSCWERPQRCCLSCAVPLQSRAVRTQCRDVQPAVQSGDVAANRPESRSSARLHPRSLDGVLFRVSVSKTEMTLRFMNRLFQD